jgi:hypothetical protein
MSFRLSAVQHKKGTSQLATLVFLNGPMTSLFHFFKKIVENLTEMDEKFPTHLLPPVTGYSNFLLIIIFSPERKLFID